MSNLAYLKLWQQKRNELPVTTDAQTDWLDMQGILDQHMPVGNTPTDGGADSGSNNAANGAGSTGTSIISKLMNLVKAKLLLPMAAITIAGAVTYYVVKDSRKPVNDQPEKIELRKDSLLNNAADSLQTADSTVTDSAAGFQQSNNAKADSLGNNPADENIATANNSATKLNADKLTTANNGRADNNTSTNKDLPKNNALDNRNRATVTGNAGTNANDELAGKAGMPNSLSLANTSTNKRNRSNSLAKPFASNGQDTRYANAGGLLNNSLSAIDHRRIISDEQYTADNHKDRVGNTLFAKRDYSPMALTVPMPILGFGWQNMRLAGSGKDNEFSGYNVAESQPKGLKKPGKISPDKNAKASKTGNSFSLGNFDVGILGGIGTNTERFVGPFVNYNFNDKWAVGAQYRLFSPYMLKGNYITPNKSSRDTLQQLLVSDSRKLHTADVPLYLMYNISKNISVKAGAIINIPLKQSDGLSTFTTNGPRTDTSSYYHSVDSTLSYTNYKGKLYLGITGGVRLIFNRLLLDLSYYQDLQTQQVTSPLGSYSFSRKGVQFSIGFKLNKPKQ